MRQFRTSGSVGAPPSDRRGYTTCRNGAGRWVSLRLWLRSTGGAIDIRRVASENRFGGVSASYASSARLARAKLPRGSTVGLLVRWLASRSLEPRSFVRFRRSRASERTRVALERRSSAGRDTSRQRCVGSAFPSLGQGRDRVPGGGRKSLRRPNAGHLKTRVVRASRSHEGKRPPLVRTRQPLARAGGIRIPL